MDVREKGVTIKTSEAVYRAKTTESRIQSFTVHSVYNASYLGGKQKWQHYLSYAEVIHFKICLIHDINLFENA